MGGSLVAVNEMMFQLLLGAVDDIRRFRSSRTVYRNGKIDQGSLRKHIPVWERGKLVNSAAYITSEMVMDGKWSVPSGAVAISRQILKAEADYIEELQAASAAGMPWRGTFPKQLEACVRCGENASWRFALKVPEGMPEEYAWRLSRPENAVPLCRRCECVVKFKKQEGTRYDLVWGLWGPRFEALHRWYLAVMNNNLPESWSREDYPLWPEEYGGRSWREGSGSYVYCSPRPPRDIARSAAHFAALNRALGMARAKRKCRERFGQNFSLLQLDCSISDSDEPGD